MQHLTLLAVCVLGALLQSGGARAADKREKPLDEPVIKVASFCSIMTARDRTPRLMVRYLWTAHAKVSLEVRLITGKAKDAPEVKPLRFLSHSAKGEIADFIYAARDETVDAAKSKSFVRDGDTFDLTAARNELGKAAVWAVRRPQPTDSPPGVAAALCQLRPWAINDKLLEIDLPRETFAEAGTLRVWLLRDDRVIWQQDVGWPGYPQK